MTVEWVLWCDGARYTISSEDCENVIARHGVTDAHGNRVRCGDPRIRDAALRVQSGAQWRRRGRP